MSLDDKNPLLNSPDGRRDDPQGGMMGQPNPGELPSQRIADSLPTVPRLEKRDEIVEALSAPPAPKPVVKSAPIIEPPKHDENIAGIIDTFEAIIIALILALTFRAFVVEAFVIPTGSMAPTLLGAHFNVICPKCGYQFAENADLSNQMVPGRELVDSTKLFGPPMRYCPNCGFDIDVHQLPDIVRTDATHVYPWANNGDRILVMKYLYSVFSPERWDVIVFKEPVQIRDNYIKRLIGLPGETIEIIDGDIYVGQGDSGRIDPNARFIQHKPRPIQDALWQIVYDNDHYPIDAGKPRVHRDAVKAELPPGKFAHEVWENPWDGPGWDNSSSTMKCDDPKGGVLTFASRERVAKNSALEFYTRNVLGYNYAETDKAQKNRRVPVGDLHLEAVWTPTRAGQTVSMVLGKPFNQWRATLTNKGGVTIERWEDGKYVEKSRGSANVPAVGVPVRLAMNNVDHVIEFYVDGKLASEVREQWSAAQAINAIKNDDYTAGSNSRYQFPTVAIETDGACTLEHVKVMRDLYYTQSAASSGDYEADGTNSNNVQSTPAFKATGTMGNPVTLGPDEFFALGDNSTSSSDGRMWPSVVPALDDMTTRRGIVPRRYLLGKAFFVYWPAGYRMMRKTYDTQLYNSPVIPNTGDMRIIR